MNILKITATHTTAGSRELKAINEEVLFSWRRRDNSIFYRLSIDSSLRFAGADFDWLFAIETGADRCEDCSILIEINCDGSFQSLFSGRLRMSAGAWNEDHCMVDIQCDLDDQYTCLFENWKDEKNILEATPQITVKFTEGTIQTTACPPSTNADPQLYDDSCLPADAGSSLWSVKSHSAQWNGTNYDIVTIWVREEITTNCVGGIGGSLNPPVGDGWILIQNNCATTGTAKYARKLSLYVDTVNSVQDLPDTLIEEYLILGQSPVEIDNGRRLEDVLNYLLPASCSLTIVSNFFDINPDASNPSNVAYTAAADYLQELIVFQKSDILRDDAFSNATKGKITLESFLSNLNALFNVYLRVDGSTLRIEHISYFEGTTGIDLVADYPERIAGFRRYTYNTDRLPRKERFQCMDQNFISPQFAGYPIEYPKNCSSEDLTVDITCDQVTTDLESMLADVNFEKFSLYGFFIGATYKVAADYYFFKTEIVHYTPTKTEYNGSLSYPNLQDSFWRHRRPQLKGTMNEVFQTFLSADRQRELPEIQIKHCCSEILTFEPSDLIVTPYGNGELQEGTWSSKSKNIKLKINV